VHVRVVKQDVGEAIAVEIAGSDRLPVRPGIGAHHTAADPSVCAIPVTAIVRVLGKTEDRVIPFSLD
jgi:hypothetical protein